MGNVTGFLGRYAFENRMHFNKKPTYMSRISCSDVYNNSLGHRMYLSKNNECKHVSWKIFSRSLLWRTQNKIGRLHFNLPAPYKIIISI